MEENSLNYHAILDTLADLFKAGKINYAQFHEQYEKLLDTARIIRCEEEETKQKQEETKQKQEETKQKQEETKQMEERTKQKQEETKQIVSNDQTKQLVSNNQTKQSMKQENTKCFISVEETKRVDIKEYSKMNSVWAETLSPLIEAGGGFISRF